MTKDNKDKLNVEIICQFTSTSFHHKNIIQNPIVLELKQGLQIKLKFQNITIEKKIKR